MPPRSSQNLFIELGLQLESFRSHTLIAPLISLLTLTAFKSTTSMKYCNLLAGVFELMLTFKYGGMQPLQAEASPFRKPTPPAQVAGDRLAQMGLLK